MTLAFLYSYNQAGPSRVCQPRPHPTVHIHYHHHHHLLTPRHIHISLLNISKVARFDLSIASFAVATQRLDNLRPHAPSAISSIPSELDETEPSIPNCSREKGKPHHKYGGRRLDLSHVEVYPVRLQKSLLFALSAPAVHFIVPDDVPQVTFVLHLPCVHTLALPLFDASKNISAGGRAVDAAC